MINTLFGIKKQMTSTYDARGRRVAATVVEIQPNIVTQVKTSDGKDAYDALQLGIDRKKSVKKPQIGHMKKAGIETKLRFLREVKTESTDIKPGQEIKVGEVFAVGDAVKVTGVSKGRGFQGGVRRHGFHGGPKTHGQSDRHRAPGSIGTGTTPGRVLKGKRMAGHMGAETKTLRNLEVVSLDKTNNLLTIKGGIPGFPGVLVRVEKLGRIKGYTPPPEEKIDEEEATEKPDEAKQEVASVESGDQSAEVSDKTEEVKEGEQNATE